MRSPWLRFFYQNLVPDKITAKCELRDVIHSLLPPYAVHIDFCLVVHAKLELQVLAKYSINVSDLTYFFPRD